MTSISAEELAFLAPDVAADDNPMIYPNPEKNESDDSCPGLADPLCYISC